MGHEDLSGLGYLRDPEDCEDCDAADGPVVVILDLPGVDADLHRHPESPHGLSDRTPAVDGGGRTLEHGQELVPDQLYPFPTKALTQELARFKQAEMVWCQEEPRNMGAWHFAEPYLEWALIHAHAKHKRARYAGRPAAAAPATGVMSKHLAQLKAFLDDVLN